MTGENPFDNNRSLGAVSSDDDKDDGRRMNAGELEEFD